MVLVDTRRLDSSFPVVLCDARDRESSKTVLVGLIQHSMNRRGRWAVGLVRLAPG